MSLLCAVLEQETHFTNVFGHDKVSNPIKSPPGSNRPVTEELYRQYKTFRDQGRGCQGVGPMQLTDRSRRTRPTSSAAAGASAEHPGRRRLPAHNIKRHGSVRGGLVRL